ncbi:hypothetical protein FQA39_LY01053 [Lamprigera yunnana]|nr:hypothetical protein FQA39_LY01053 [Lamprigera yunnana]
MRKRKQTKQSLLGFETLRGLWMCSFLTEGNVNLHLRLNKSKSKWISVGLYYPFEFASVVKIFGRSKQYVIFKEEEWIQFHEQRENINKYFQTFDTMWKPRQIGSKTLTFEMIKEKKILKIEDMSGNEVYLGWESVSEVWSLESVLRYRLSYSSGSNFKYFYEGVIRAVAEISGDVKINIYNIINRLSEKSDDVCYKGVNLRLTDSAIREIVIKKENDTNKHTPVLIKICKVKEQCRKVELGLKDYLPELRINSKLLAHLALHI